MTSNDLQRGTSGGSPQDPEEYADAILRTTSQPFLTLDGALIVQRANRAFYELFAASPAETEGRPIWDLGNGQWNIPELRRLLEDVLGGEPEVIDYRIEHDFETLGRRIMLVSARRIDRDGRPAHILISISDITAAEQLRAEVAAQKIFADKLIDSVREGLVILDFDLLVQAANQSFYDCFDVDPNETEGRLIYDLGDGQWNIPRLRQLLEAVLPNNETFDDYEVDHDFETLGRRSMLLNARRVNHLDLILLAIRDVTDVKRAQTRQRVLLGELQHRIKNLIGNVRALSEKTLRNSQSLEEFGKAFHGRLDALSRAQDDFLETGEVTASLRELVKRELHAHGAVEGTNLKVAGPDVRLQGPAVQPMQLAIHELATNAVKYGALSDPKGTVEIEWVVERRQTVPFLRIRWREMGVRLDKPIRRKGYGSELIEKSLPYMLDGDVALNFGGDGVECVIAFSLPPDASDAG